MEDKENKENNENKGYKWSDQCKFDNDSLIYILSISIVFSFII